MTHYDQIIENLTVLNAASPAVAKKKKPAPAAAPAIPTTLTADDLLEFTVRRIVAALDLEEAGVTAEKMISQVKEAEQAAAEQPYVGVVQ